MFSQVQAILDRLEQQLGEANKAANLTALAFVAQIIGIRIEEKEKMKAPKTELVSTLRVGAVPTNGDRAPLTAALMRNKGELPAKTLWTMSGLEIDAFYQQLKAEMTRGWIVQPEAAYMKVVEVG